MFRQPPRDGCLGTVFTVIWFTMPEVVGLTDRNTSRRTKVTTHLELQSMGACPSPGPNRFCRSAGFTSRLLGGCRFPASPHTPTLHRSSGRLESGPHPLNIWAKKRGYLLHSLSELTLMRCDLNMEPPSTYRPYPLPSQCFLDRAVAYLSELEDCLWHGGSPNHWTPQVSNHVCQLCRKQGPGLLCDFVVRL